MSGRGANRNFVSFANLSQAIQMTILASLTPLSQQ